MCTVTACWTAASSSSLGRASLGRARLPALLQRLKPSIVIVELGANDALRGVPLATTVDGLRADVGARRERAVRADATLAGPRATAVILTALPGLGVLLGAGFGADPLGVLLGGTLGGALCLAGAVLLAAGLVWTDRIAGGAGR